MADIYIQLKNTNGDRLFPRISLENLESDSSYHIPTVQEWAAVTSGGLVREVVDELPPIAEADNNTVYMVPKDASDSSQGQNQYYDEFIVVIKNDVRTWEKIGDTAVSLADYYTKKEVNEILSDALEGYAPINSPALTGAPTTPDPSIAAGIANKKYVDDTVSDAIEGLDSTIDLRWVTI